MVADEFSGCCTILSGNGRPFWSRQHEHTCYYWCCWGFHCNSPPFILLFSYRSSLGNYIFSKSFRARINFQGLSSHSTLLSGILMFMITYASPMLSLLGLVMYISVKDLDRYLNVKEVNMGYLLKMNLGFPCLIPLSLNSVILTAYTVVLLLMRNHLFIWSVFSPK